MKLGIDAAGWLTADRPGAVVYFPTVRTTSLDGDWPRGLVWHWTGGAGGPGFAANLARRAQAYRRGVDRPASWHLIIARETGVIVQSAPMTIGTWHVGRAGVVGRTRFANVNRATVGCELENAGFLREIDGRFYCWPYYLNPKAPAQERKPDPRCDIARERAVRLPSGKIVDAFTPAQEETAVALVSALATAYGWSREVAAYCHADFDPKRKDDPGPLWRDTVLPRVLDAVFGAAPPAGAEVA